MVLILFIVALFAGVFGTENQCGTSPEVCDSKRTVRSYDGSCTNLRYPKWGSTKALYARMLPGVYGDGEYQR